MPVTTLLRATLDLALRAPDLTEAVVGLDAVVGTRCLTLERLQRASTGVRGRHGARQAVRAIELARLGVRSSWESRLRMCAGGQSGP